MPTPFKFTPPRDLGKFADMLASHQPEWMTIDRKAGIAKISCAGCEFEETISEFEETIRDEPNLKQVSALTTTRLRQAFGQHQADMIAPLI